MTHYRRGYPFNGSLGLISLEIDLNRRAAGTFDRLWRWKPVPKSVALVRSHPGHDRKVNAKLALPRFGTPDDPS